MLLHAPIAASAAAQAAVAVATASAEVHDHTVLQHAKATQPQPRSCCRRVCTASGSAVMRIFAIAPHRSASRRSCTFCSATCSSIRFTSTSCSRIATVTPRCAALARTVLRRRATLGLHACAHDQLAGLAACRAISTAAVQLVPVAVARSIAFQRCDVDGSACSRGREDRAVYTRGSFSCIFATTLLADAHVGEVQLCSRMAIVAAARSLLAHTYSTWAPTSPSARSSASQETWSSTPCRRRAAARGP